MDHVSPVGSAGVPGTRRAAERLRLPREIAPERWQGLVLLLPALLVLLLVLVYPLLYSLGLSFVKWNYVNPDSVPSFVGLRNYLGLFLNEAFVQSFLRTTLFAGGTVTVQFLVALLLVVLLTRDVPGKLLIEYLRGLLLIPLILSPVVAGILFRTLFNSEYGLVNYGLRMLGLPAQNWLANQSLSLLPPAIADTWQNVPLVFLILLGGIQSLPVDPFRAARVDGASEWQIFRHITLPLLKPFLVIALIIRVMDAFKVFDIVYSMTLGGPGTSTEVLAIHIYRQGLKFFHLDTAASASWVLMLVVFLISLYLFRQLRSSNNP